jgi:S1-C subfamily serine protease
MKSTIISVLLACAVLAAPIGLDAGAVTAESDLKRAFEQRTGIQLAFDRAELPAGGYFETMPPLGKVEQLRAARIAFNEANKYPAGYLKSVGLKCIGIFRGCVSTKGDGYRRYDSALQGFRYYGISNGHDAVAAAYYSDRQLPLTLHHEIFHLIDATIADDSRFADAIAGRRPYSAPILPAIVLTKLRAAGRGSVLEDVVSDYCRKNTTEDKAETARYLMTNLADSLVQVATRPALPGTQRILHVLATYEHSQPSYRMDVQWFVDIALRRDFDIAAVETTPAEAQNPYLKNVNTAITNETVRKAISRVQPSCVRLDNASGVNLTANGYILTAAHVARRLGQTLSAQLPDGRTFPAKCVAIDRNLDLAMLRADADSTLAFAPLARRTPAIGTRVICIGQPGSTTPSGKPTHYKPFTVSTGRIRDLMADPLGDQSLGRVSHDAWTYWGHSGSPLFDENGQIVAMHNSWDSKTSMRHAVPYEAIVHFLDQAHVPYTKGG